MLAIILYCDVNIIHFILLPDGVWRRIQRTFALCWLIRSIVVMVALHDQVEHICDDQTWYLIAD